MDTLESAASAEKEKTKDRKERNEHMAKMFFVMGGIASAFLIMSYDSQGYLFNYAVASVIACFWIIAFWLAFAEPGNVTGSELSGWRGRMNNFWNGLMDKEFSEKAKIKILAAMLGIFLILAPLIVAYSLMG